MLVQGATSLSLERQRVEKLHVAIAAGAVQAEEDKREAVRDARLEMQQAMDQLREQFAKEKRDTDSVIADLRRELRRRSEAAKYVLFSPSRALYGLLPGT